ncbi:MAG TPA: L,D-transpeptidase, partial [Polyangiales bacterium]|nr:L,D-transpeptidase [Polyangiales bacterium]
MIAALLLSAGCQPKPAAERSDSQTVTAQSAVRPAAASTPTETPPSPAPALIPAAVAPARTEQPSAPRVYAKTRFVWIYGEPNAERQWIGFLRSGNSVALRSTKPLAGPGCGAFYAIEPQGYVCADGKRATLDPNDPVYQAVAPFATKSDSPTPHRYAESLGAARYTTLPTEEQQTWRERDLRAHLRNVESARQGTEVKALAGVDLSVPSMAPPSFPPLPITVFEDRKELTARSTVAYSTE